MTGYIEQIQRIKGKLREAKMIDKRYKVFGAESHKYILNQPVTEADVLLIEEKYNIQLPEEYKAFITHVGNGGPGYSNAGAGPYYGIYPLGERVDELLDNNTEDYLNNTCILYPKMTDSHWEYLNKDINKNECVSDELYTKSIGNLFAGILPLGSQGCSYVHGLVLNGTYKGRVVNLDLDRQKPKFAFETNFLDWYERWLDEVTSGELINAKSSWFGYYKGGSEDDLLSALTSSHDLEEENDNLNGLLNKKKLSDQALCRIERLLVSSIERRNALIQLLCKSNYERAKPYLIELAQRDLCTLFQFVYWYAKEKSNEWLPFIEKNLHRIDDEETFRHFTYLLKETNADIGRLVEPFTKSSDENIKVQAFYILGELRNKKAYIECFIEGLQDPSSRVVNATLQALSNVKDTRLLDYYRQIAEKFPTEHEYISANLTHRLSEYGLTIQAILHKEVGSAINSTASEAEKRWYEIWK